MHGEGGDIHAPNVSSSLWQLIYPIKQIIYTNVYYFIQGYPFQIGYSEVNCITGNSTLPTFTLYLVAATDKERGEWIRAIRKGDIF